MTSLSTAPSTGLSGGGRPSPVPAPRGAQITVTTRGGVATWNTCQGVADFVTSLLGEPASRVEVSGP